MIALGSNEGERRTYLEQACAEVDALPLTRLVAVSDMYESEPAYISNPAPYLNAVAVLESSLSAPVLLEHLLRLEIRMGRKRPGDPRDTRSIDLDLLWAEGTQSFSDTCTVPHPRMGERHFVLTPLADLIEDVTEFLQIANIPYLEPENRYGRIIAHE